MEDGKPFNTMCLDCEHLGGLCSGTTAKFYSGCVWKNAAPESVKAFSDSMQEAIDNRKEEAKK